MEKLIKKTTVVFALLAMVFSGMVLAEESEVFPPESNYHITVETNKNLYHHRDVVRLTVKLLNNSPDAVHIWWPEPIDVNEGNINDVEIGQGLLDGEIVDGEIRPSWPIVIGYATLTPLRPVASTDDQEIWPPANYRVPLRLFGSPVIAPHSTRIISLANILVRYPPIVVDSNGAEPNEPVSAMGRYIAVRPGYYLLNCYVNKIAGAKMVRAQKIIRIAPRKPDPVVKIIKENTKTLRKLDRRTEKMAKVDKNTNSTTRRNSYMLRAILRYLTGSRRTTTTQNQK